MTTPQITTSFRNEMASSKRTELVFFEFADEIDSFVHQKGLDYLQRTDLKIMAVELSAQSRLTKLNLPYLNTLQFLGKDGHKEIISASNHVIQDIQQWLDITDDLGIIQGYNKMVVYYIRFYIHHLLFVSHIINKALIDLKPDKLYFPETTIPKKRSSQISTRERYLGAIAEQYCIKKGINYEVILSLKNHSNNEIEYSKSSLKEKAKKVVFFLSLFLLSHHFFERKYILALSEDYNMPRVLRDFSDIYRDMSPLYLYSKKTLNSITYKLLTGSLVPLPSVAPKKYQKAFNEKVKKAFENITNKLFKKTALKDYQGSELLQFIIPFLDDSIYPLLKNLYGRSYHLLTFLLTVRPSLIIAQHSVGIGQNLGELCRECKIPALLISHGSHTPPKNCYEMIEWGEHGKGLMNTDFSYLAVQTPLAQEYLKCCPSKSINVKTGPLLFAKKYEKKLAKSELRDQLLPRVKDRFIIIHAGTPKTRKALRFFVYETVDEYLSNINDLIKATEKMKDVHLIIRFRSSPDLTLDDFTLLLYPSHQYSICTDRTFEDYLMISDLLCSYSSTTIEEALQNHIPVLQYDSQGKYQHIPSQTLSETETPYPDTCYFVNNQENLQWAIKWIINNHLMNNDQLQLNWDKHIFPDNEVTDIREYFRFCFYN